MTVPAEPPRDPGALLGALLSESQKLRADVQERERRQRKLIGLIAVATVFCLVMVTSVVVLLVQSRQRGNDTRALLRTNAATNERIADCTTVGGRCYEEGSRRSADVIKRLLIAIEEIAICNKGSEDAVEARACADRALAKLGVVADPSPSPGGTP